MYDEMTEALVKIARGYYIILDAYLKLCDIEIYGNKESLFYDRLPCSPSSIAKKRTNSSNPFSRDLNSFELCVVRTVCSVEHFVRDAKNGNPSGLRMVIEENAGIVMKCHSLLNHIKEVQRNE